MFELFKAKLDTLFTTYRRMAKKIYKDINLEESEEKKFEDMVKKLMTEDLATGDIELVENDVKTLIEEIKHLIDSVIEVEKLDLLFVDKLGDGLQEQLGMEKKVKIDIDHLKVSDAVFDTCKEFKSIDELKDHIKTKMESIFKNMRDMNHVEMASIKDMHKKLTQEHWALSIASLDMQRLSQMSAMFKSFPHYQAEQSSRYVKWNLKSELAQIERLEGDLERLENYLKHGIQNSSDITHIVKILDVIEKETKGEDALFSKLIGAIMFIFNYEVYKFFTYFRKYANQYYQQIDAKLTAEDFPKDHLEVLHNAYSEMRSGESAQVLDAERIAGIERQNQKDL